MSLKSVFAIGTVIGILNISGCATPHDLLKTKPVVSFVTEKSPNDVKKCILKSWRKHLTNVQEERISQGWLIRHYDNLPSVTVAIVTIEGNEPEVKVNYYHRTNRIKLHRLEEEVMGCK